MNAIIIAFMLALAQLPTPGQKHKEAPNAQEAKQTKSHEMAPTSPAPIIIDQVGNCPPSENKQQDDANNAASKAHDWLEKFNGASTGIIALFTVLAVIAVTWQVITSRQIERAWISVEIENNTKLDEVGIPMKVVSDSDLIWSLVPK